MRDMKIIDKCIFILPMMFIYFEHQSCNVTEGKVHATVKILALKMCSSSSLSSIDRVAINKTSFATAAFLPE